MKYVLVASLIIASTSIFCSTITVVIFDEFYYVLSLIYNYEIMLTESNVPIRCLRAKYKV